MTMYILDSGHNPVPCADVQQWGAFFEANDGCRVDLTNLPNGYRVSTVFLGIDHGFGLDASDLRPVLFETMVFPESPDGEYQERFRTWDEARAGHADACLKAAEWPAVEASNAQ